MRVKCEKMVAALGRKLFEVSGLTYAKIQPGFFKKNVSIVKKGTQVILYMVTL